MKKIKRLKHIDYVADQWIQISMRGLSVYDRYEIDGCTGHVKSVNVGVPSSALRSSSLSDITVIILREF